MAFELSKEMSQTDEGKKALIDFFGTSDPYRVCKNLIIGDNPTYRTCNVQNVKVYPKVLLADGSGTTECNFCTVNYMNNSVLPTQYNGWYGENIGNNQIYGADWVKICNSKTLDNKCIDDIMYANNYKADRVNAVEGVDEANFILGIWLGYDTLQMTNSANGSGFWQYEIMELRGYPPETKNRDYSSFIQLLPTKDDPTGKSQCPTNSMILINKFIPSFETEYLKNVSQHITLRDPFDVYNENKVKKCVLPPYPNKNINSYNMTCADNISNIYSNLSIEFTNPTCDGSIPKA